MNDRKFQFFFLLIILSGTAGVTFFIFKPFFSPLVLAVVFAIVFQPIYQKILNYTGGRRGISAFITTIIIVTFIGVPLIFLGMKIFQETRELYASLIDGAGLNQLYIVLNGLMAKWQVVFHQQLAIPLNIDQRLKQGIEWAFLNMGFVFSGLTTIAIDAFIFFVALYYMLKDGTRLKHFILNLSPLTPADNETIFNKLKGAVVSVTQSNLLIASIQGLLAMVGFFIFKVPNPALWGSVTAIAALIPGFGTSLVFVPIILFLFFTQKIGFALGLLIWALLAVGLVDNFLSPKLVGRGVHLHPLIILLSVLGGIGFFGPIGFLMGPCTASLLFALLDIYFVFIKEKKILPESQL